MVDPRREGAHGPRGWQRCVFAVALVLVLTAAGRTQARVFLSRDQALQLAFGEEATVKRASVFLTDQQLTRARDLAGDGVEIEGALVVQYVGQRHGQPIGTAYFDTHAVRTLEQTLMIVVTPDGRVGRLEILAFQEPQEYLPRNGWLEQFRDRPLDRELSLRRGIHGITGATLSAQAVTDATRRVLAIHQAIASGQEPTTTPGSAR